MTNKMKLNLLNLAILTILLSIRGDDASDDLKIKVNRQIKNKGFHRILKTDIEILNLNYKYYNWMLIEQFDANMYVDVHEIKQAYYGSSYTALFSNKVSTETAEYRSQSFKLFLYLNNDRIQCDFIETNQTSYACKFSIELPVHARYKKPASHASRPNQAYFNFTLSRPRIFIRNLNDNKTNDLSVLSVVDQLDTNSLNLVFPCQKSSYDYLFQIKSLANNTDYSICEWTNLDFESASFNETDSFEIEIPIGNSDYEMIVLIVTLVVVTFVALSVARCVSKKVQSVTCICGDINREVYEDGVDDEKEKFNPSENQSPKKK